MSTKGNVVVHVREDSREDLEALFNHLMNPVAASVVPMRNRNLPPSFFNPSASDRRNNNTLKPPDIEGLTISHSRAHSSPAAFTVPANSPPNLSTHHSRSQSYDANEDGPLPPGWEMATTESGFRYFMNSHIDRTTSWEDPRKSLSTNNLNSQPLGPFPDGWEQARTPSGEIYYINHRDRTTSWVDPRLNMNQLQQQQQQQQQQNIPPPPSQIQQPAQPIRQERKPPMQTLHEMQLQKVQLEKERLRRRHQQLVQQEILLKRGLVDDRGSNNTNSLLGKLTREAFMGMPAQENTANAEHLRNGSNDSGLGMAYYPQEVEMGTYGEEAMQQGESQNFVSSSANFNSKDSRRCSNERSERLPELFESVSGTNVDSSSMDTSDSGVPMESDDLGLGLDGINSDILNDVESVISPNKIDNLLTWI